MRPLSSAASGRCNGLPTSSRANLLRTASHQRAEAGQRFGPNPVIGPDAALLAVDKPGVVKDLQVMADRWLRQVECVIEIAHACLASRMGGYEGHQPQPYGIG